jgi:hypothetical protein
MREEVGELRATFLPRLVFLVQSLERAVRRATEAFNDVDEFRQDVIGLLEGIAEELELESIDEDGRVVDVGKSQLAEECWEVSDRAAEMFSRFERPVWITRLRRLVENRAFNPNRAGLDGN